MFNFIFVLAIVIIVVAFIALPMSVCEWAAENHRVPFFVKMYRKWCIKKGKQVVANAKKD